MKTAITIKNEMTVMMFIACSLHSVSHRLPSVGYRILD